MARSHHRFRIPTLSPTVLSPRDVVTSFQPRRPPSVCGNSSSISTANSPSNPKPAFVPPPPSSAYIHLPFCRKRCHYCNFPIVALGTTSTTTTSTGDDPRIANYVNLLLQDIHATKTTPYHNPPLQTIFFGGGTPSLVPPHLISSILDALRSKFGVQEEVEISMEMDPGTFDATKLDQLLDLGLNRVSLGVQAFQDELLKTCGRAHGLEEVHEAIGMVTNAAKLTNWSIDIISSLPHQTLEMWEETLSSTIEAQPNHISVYDLQVEQGTKFGHLYTPGEFPLPAESQSADFYKMASKSLRGAGYNHYEISSYCKEGFECKHNFVYWSNQSFYGFGLGAASYLNGRRFSRPRRMGEYAAFVKKIEDELLDEDGTAAPLDARDMAMDVVMLSLRTAVGLDIRCFSEMFGQTTTTSLCRALDPFVASGHVVALDQKRRALSTLKAEGGDTDGALAYIRLSDPEGFLLSNELISKAFAEISC